MIGDNPHSGVPSLPETVAANPTHIWVEPTNRCNTRCTHCAHYYSRFGEDMPGEMFRKIQDALFDDVKAVELIGYGEPLLAADFNDMLDACLSRGIRVLFTTNGILLRSDALLTKLVRADVEIALSIDGARAETHEFVRPYIKWEKMVEILECIKRNADAAGPEKRFSLRFNFVPMRQNIGDLPDLVRLAAKYGARTVFLLPLAAEDSLEKVRGQSLRNEPELAFWPVSEAVRLSRTLGVKLTVPPFLHNLTPRRVNAKQALEVALARLSRKGRAAVCYLRRWGFRTSLRRILCARLSRAKTGVARCLMPWQDTYLAANGTVFPCCIMGEKLGDIDKQEWAEIWNGPLYRNLRRTIHSWNPSAVCRYCGFPSGINGGDEKRYTDFLSKFRFEPLPLDSPSVEFGEGFHDLERLENGSASHRWMARTGLLSLPMPKKARFLRFNIIPRSPILPDTNPGRCRINGGCWEPFDNTCPDITFPLDHVREDRLRIEFEMENAPQAPGDPRHLGLAISGIHFLFPR
jgi:MoaA/NifB/PqqE/SkfB family radical SAM enzyme